MVPLRLVGLLVGLEGGARPRSYRGPALAELGHPDVTTGDAACLRRYSKGTVLSTLLQGTRPRYASDTLMSLTDNTVPLSGLA